MCTSVSKLTERGSSTRNTKQAQLRHLAVTASDFSKYTCPMRNTRTYTVHTSKKQIADCWPEEVWGWSEGCGVRARCMGLKREARGLEW